MADLIAEFFQVVGIEGGPPSTMAELIPYLLTVLIGVALVSGVFFVLGKLADVVLDFTRFHI